MKLKFKTEIDAPIDTVWAAFNDAGQMGRWMQNFHSFNVVSGEAGQPGSSAELVFDENGRKVVLTETVTDCREPDFLATSFESPHGTTTIVHHFESLETDRTRWSSWCNFSFRGFMRFMSLFIGGVIRRRTEGDMARFKLMVESDLAENSE